jgi:hypothetical protein
MGRERHTLESVIGTQLKIITSAQARSCTGPMQRPVSQPSHSGPHGLTAEPARPLPTPGPHCTHCSRRLLEALASRVYRDPVSSAPAPSFHYRRCHRRRNPPACRSWKRHSLPEEEVRMVAAMPSGKLSMGGRGVGGCLPGLAPRRGPRTSVIPAATISAPAPRTQGAATHQLWWVQDFAVPTSQHENLACCLCTMAAAAQPVWHQCTASYCTSS